MNLELRPAVLLILLTNTIPGLAQVLPDPTRPAEYQAAPLIQDLPQELVDWKVTAIRISEHDRTALVNGKIARVGDTIGPARILEIQPIQVILDYNDRKVAVRLFSNVSLRKPVTNDMKTETKIQ